MHFTNSASTLILSLLATTAAANYCERRSDEGVYRYTVHADSVDDVPGICGGLWDNLKQFNSNCVPTTTSCGVGTPGGLTWVFTASGFCNEGMVEATWYDATKNKFGSITCVEG
ncbi:hypothetical protein P280DRAFT_466706 [Massarina eburnea CBS 473.64]|uniref:Uncharacterized protein n=1 Tax=Massarina eburnea CBS 473.64 TaxID=1395130 RepID=A0A6A6S8C2_9PLEO|nr:hypothetical protein P280DRAFT_466706 [Massarina eburnea CBS 473.64]